MKIKEKNTLEDLLNSNDLTDMNERTIFQDDIITTIGNEKPQPPSGHGLLKAKGNAQLKDFIEYVGLIAETIFEEENLEFRPYEKTFATKEDADLRLMNPIISYKVLDRRYKEGTAYAPRSRDTIVDDIGRTGELYSEQFVSKVQFQIICMEYNKAWEIMDRFEELMINYRTYIKEKGISNYYFLNQDEDTYCQDFLEIVTVLTLNYIVETEKNRVIFKENINNIHIRGEAVNSDGTPISTTSTENNK